MKGLVVELIGPAGAGKTTLTGALGRCDTRSRPVDLPFYRSPAQAPFFVRSTLRSLPMLVDLYRQRTGRWFTRRELASIVILNGWPHVLRRRAASTDEVLILDQGPIYLLAELSLFGPTLLAGQAAEPWRERLYREWSQTLDLVFWLDASDAVLAGRIRHREQWHVVKGEPDETIRAFQGQFRAAYQRTLASLAEVGREPRLLKLDTGTLSVTETLGRILDVCGLDGRERDMVCGERSRGSGDPGQER